jgi:hypothetical protein
VRRFLGPRPSPGRAYPSEWQRLRARLLQRYPNASNFPNAWRDLYTLPREDIAAMVSLSDFDLDVLIKRREDFDDVFAEITGRETIRQYRANPLWYHGGRTNAGVS